MQLDNWGAFTIGVIVAVFLFVLWYTYDKRLAGFSPSPENPSEDRMESFVKNLRRSYNPIGNISDVFCKPWVAEKNERILGMDGIRALVFFWVLAFEIDYLLSLMSEDYKDSKWSEDKDSAYFFWRVAAQGYEGLSVFFVLSAFMFTYANVALCYDEPDDDYSSGGSSILSKHLFLFCRRIVRVWPALAASVLFVGFMWPKWINAHSDILDTYFLDRCESVWWTNIYFIANFWSADCFLDLWAVSLNFQLAFIVPIPAYLFAQGDTKRSYAYILVYTIIVLSIVSRLVLIYSLDIYESPVDTKLKENKYNLQRMPWSRAGEYCMGILCCFSVLEDKEGEPPHIRDIFHIVTETMRNWMRSFELFSLTFLQTWTILLGAFFVYEGTLQRYGFPLTMELSGTVTVLLLGDIIVASLFALMLRWAINVDGGWLRFVLEWPIWYPVSCLSYSAFLFQLAAAYWAVEIMKDNGHDVKTGYLYFSKIYFTTLMIALGLALMVHITIERPLIKLADSNRQAPLSILADDRDGYSQAPTTDTDAVEMQGEGSEAVEATTPQVSTKTRPAPVGKSKAKGKK